MAKIGLPAWFVAAGYIVAILTKILFSCSPDIPRFQKDAYADIFDKFCLAWLTGKKQLRCACFLWAWRGHCIHQCVLQEWFGERAWVGQAIPVTPRKRRARQPATRRETQGRDAVGDQNNYSAVDSVATLACLVCCAPLCPTAFVQASVMERADYNSPVLMPPVPGHALPVRVEVLLWLGFGEVTPPSWVAITAWIT